MPRSLGALVQHMKGTEIQASSPYHSPGWHRTGGVLELVANYGHACIETYIYIND